jgi:hypothetical protein
MSPLNPGRRTAGAWDEAQLAEEVELNLKSSKRPVEHDPRIQRALVPS